MAVLGDEIWLQWSGGLRSNVHASQIGEDEVADGQNFISIDGTVRMDQRYALFAEVSSAGLTAQGSGYGKYGTGVLSEQYVMAVSNQLYQLDLTDDDAALTPVIGAASLSEGEWYFTQFKDFLYAGHATAGLARKLIGAGTGPTRKL